MANNFSRFDNGIQIGNGFASDPPTGLVGEIYYNTVKGLTRICTQSTPTVVWEDQITANGTTSGSLLTWQPSFQTYAENLGVIVSGYMVGGIPDSGNNINPAANIYISGSNKTAGTGNGGNLYLQGGSSSGGVQGNVILIGTAIQFQNGSQGTSGSYWVSTDVNGSGSWQTPPAAGANRTLSNLLNPTAINQNLLSATGNTYQVGNISNAWTNVVSNTFSVSDGANYYVNLGLNGSTPSGTNTTANLSFPENNRPAGIWTSSNASGSSSLLIETGNASSGNSGGLAFTIGTASATRGQISFKDGTEGTAGWIWSSTDTIGSGHWTQDPHVIMYYKPLSFTANASFTIPSTNSYVQLTSSTIVTSNGTTAISNGSFAGQVMTIENFSGGNNITIVNGANTSLPGAANYTLQPNGTMQLIWNGTLWRTIAASSN